MQRDIVANGPEPGIRVVDTIAEGLSVAFARPWLMLLPLLADLYYWIGWSIRLEALSSGLGRLIDWAGVNRSNDVETFLAHGAKWDATSLVSILMPTMLGDADRTKLYEPIAPGTVTPMHWYVDIAIVLGIALLTVLLLMSYSVFLADAVLERKRDWRATGTAIILGWTRFIGLFFVLVGLALIVLGPFVLAAAGLAMFSLDPTALLAVTGTLGFAGVLVILFFAPEAIVVSEVGPLRAVQLSLLVTKRYFWQAAGFTAAFYLLTAGLAQLWLRLAGTAPGLLIAVVANAFFASGLAMASMLFYNERMRVLRPEFAVETPHIS